MVTTKTVTMMGSHICRVCGGAIHPKRMEAQPRAQTCSPAHSKALHAVLKREAAQRQRRRRRDSGVGLKKPISEQTTTTETFTPVRPPQTPW